jgi:rhomboid protease GluP
MTAPEPPTSPEIEPFPEGTVDAGVYATQAEGIQHSLVPLAMGETCWLVKTEDGHHLRVEPASIDTVGPQLKTFDRESVGWPPRPVVDKVPPRRHAPLTPLLWVLGVFAIFWAQLRWPALTEATVLDADRVFDHGEWWRAATALWLHGDLSHLVSNAGGGLLVFSAVMATFGTGVGWCLLAASAIMGNLLAVALHLGDNYRSLGSSTAIFAGLGLLSGRAVRVVTHAGRPHRWRTMLVPLAAGIIVLGLFGAGGVNIDVLAHATGFGSGLVTGFAAGKPVTDGTAENAGPLKV